MNNQPNNAQTQIVNNKLALLTFKVAGQTYGLPIAQITRIIEMVAITKLPQAPSFVQGIINVRGKTVLIIDLNLRFDLAFQPYGLHTPIILTEFKDRDLGLVVDSVEEVLEINPDTLESSDSIIPLELIEEKYTVAQQTYLQAVVKKDRKLIPILALEALLNPVQHARLMQLAKTDTTLEAANLEGKIT